MNARLRVEGEVRVPGDKSISHRALIMGALAVGESRVRGILRSEDVESTAHVLRTLGAEIPALGDDIAILGRGPTAFLPPASNLNCGNSGTTARLLMGVTAAQSFASTFTGDPSLSRRPMRRVAAPLSAMGARVEFFGADDGLPLTVHGERLKPIEWRLESASAQVKSAILLAGVCARVPVCVIESAPTRDHTERFLRLQGARIEVHGQRIELEACESLAPFEIDVPGDPSSAAFFVALGVVAAEGQVTVRNVALNPGRIGFFNVLQRMGADLSIVEHPTSGPEPMGDIVARPSVLRATTIGGDEIPSLIDELPLLACIAARAEGETQITGAEELRVKESDRIARVVENLRRIGVDARELPDGMRIAGTREHLRGGVEAHADHRLAMAFGILGATDQVDVTIDDPACVAVSYPEFWTDLARVTGAQPS